MLCGLSLPMGVVSFLIFFHFSNECLRKDHYCMPFTQYTLRNPLFKRGLSNYKQKVAAAGASDWCQQIFRMLDVNKIRSEKQCFSKSSG